MTEIDVLIAFENFIRTTSEVKSFDDWVYDTQQADLAAKMENDANEIE